MNFSSRYPFSFLIKRMTPVLLYHSIVEDYSTKSANLHQVSMEKFEKDIFWFKQYFDIISIDEMSNIDDKRGKVAITFDDGYLSTFKYAIPFLISNRIPSTVFLNGATIDRNLLWRDKVRYLINSNLTEKFHKFLILKNLNLSLSKENFYFSSKNPNINSKVLDGLIDEFILINGGYHDDFMVNDSIATLDDLIKNQYVSYGNHGFNHYVMSSLSAREQQDEIHNNEIFFENNGFDLSKVFSVPFGGKGTYNEKTINLLAENNYKSIFLSRNRFHKGNFLFQNSKLIDRFMPQNSDIENLLLLGKMYLKSLLYKSNPEF